MRAAFYSLQLDTLHMWPVGHGKGLGGIPGLRIGSPT